MINYIIDSSNLSSNVTLTPIPTFNFSNNACFNVQYNN